MSSRGSSRSRSPTRRSPTRRSPLPRIRAEDVRESGVDGELAGSMPTGPDLEALREWDHCAAHFDVSTPNVNPKGLKIESALTGVDMLFAEHGEDMGKVVHGMKKLSEKHYFDARVMEAAACLAQLLVARETARKWEEASITDCDAIFNYEKKADEAVLSWEHDVAARCQNGAITSLLFTNRLRSRIPNFSYFTHRDVSTKQPCRVRNVIGDSLGEVRIPKERPLAELFEVSGADAVDEMRALLLQVVLAYATAYHEFGYSHNDFRYENVACVKLPGRRSITYDIGGERYTVLTRHVAVIRRPDFSHVEVPVRAEDLARLGLRESSPVVGRRGSHFVLHSGLPNETYHRGPLTLHDLVHIAVLWANKVSHSRADRGEVRDAVAWALRPLFGDAEIKLPKHAFDLELNFANEDVDPLEYARQLIATDARGVVMCGDAPRSVKPYYAPPERNPVEEVSPLLARLACEAPAFPRMFRNDDAALLAHEASSAFFASTVENTLLWLESFDGPETAFRARMLAPPNTASMLSDAARLRIVEAMQGVLHEDGRISATRLFLEMLRRCNPRPRPRRASGAKGK